MKIICSILKRVILGGFLLYGYNLIAVNFNMVLPINVITLIIVSILGSPALCALVLFKIIIL